MNQPSNDAYRQPPPPRQRTSFVVELLQTLILALGLYLGVSLLTDRVRVENISMQPTLEDSDLLLVNKVIYNVRPPDYGEVIVFHYSHNPPEDYIKRVVGLPGDTVTIQGGQVYVNGTPLDEPYLQEPTEYEGQWEVPEGNLFVLGDNRNLSSDSHVWGFVPLEEVVGRADLIYWPPDKAELLLPSRSVHAKP